MVKGFTVPRSPLGLAAIDPPPPWYYSGDVLGAEFWADPAATAALLPEGLTPDPETNGHAALMFVDWQFTASNDEYLDPARYQYREAFVTIDARWGAMKVTFCPFIYVDNDAAMVRGWTQGFPKQLGSIFQTRTFAAPSPAMAPVEPGGRFAGSLSCHGQRLADVKVTLQQTEADPTTLPDGGNPDPCGGQAHLWRRRRWLSFMLATKFNVLLVLYRHQNHTVTIHS